MYSVPQGTEIEIFRKVAPASAVSQPFHIEQFLSVMLPFACTAPCAIQ